MRVVNIVKYYMKFRSFYYKDELSIEKGYLGMRMKIFFRGIRFFFDGWGGGLFWYYSLIYILVFNLG